MAEALSEWHGRPPTSSALDAMLRLAGSAPLPDVGPFDVVLSPCVLSQTIDPVLRLLGPRHPARHPFAAALRRRHVRLISRLLKPGGRGILAIDLVSSAYRPDLSQAAPDDLPQVLRACLSAETHFLGLSPAAVTQTLQADPTLSGLRLTCPWLWHLAIRKSFLVYAALFRKNST
jgi:hypothetical protein